jgi:hypothetical protein
MTIILGLNLTQFERLTQLATHAGGKLATLQVENRNGLEKLGARDHGSIHTEKSFLFPGSLDLKR